ncbi:hypothetical protein BY458DRAFT_508244 [Sporodiniella umbellata]|nr:hypothetical protein BY458DRAFT_508244 [Sporodiniella umbellata]
MSQARYNTFSNSLETIETHYYSASELTNSLERFGSSRFDFDVLGITVSRLSKDQQMLFFRKVLTITAGQFLLTCLFCLFLHHVYPLFQWLKDSTYSWWVVLMPAIGLACVMLWQLKTQFYQLSLASQMTMASFYSLALAVVVSHTVSKLIYREGILVMIMTLSGLACLTSYTFQTKFAFTGTLPFVISLGAVCLSSLWLRWIYEMDPLEIVFPIGASGLVCSYIILELYFIMNSLLLEDYILANVYLFVDLVYPIRFIHHFCELTDNMNAFPDILYPGDV